MQVEERFKLDINKETMVQNAVINTKKVNVGEPLTLIGWGRNKASFVCHIISNFLLQMYFYWFLCLQLPGESKPNSVILQRLDTGSDWKHIPWSECKKLVRAEPHLGDLCTIAPNYGIYKSSGYGDSGGPLYLTHRREESVEQSLGELV